jgi:hypothetical protein
MGNGRVKEGDKLEYSCKDNNKAGQWLKIFDYVCAWNGEPNYLLCIVSLADRIGNGPRRAVQISVYGIEGGTFEGARKQSIKTSTAANCLRLPPLTIVFTLNPKGQKDHE